MNNKKAGFTTAMAALMALVLAHDVSAETILKPKYNLSGQWQANGDPSQVINYFQEGTQVTFINIANGFAHYFVGRYITPIKFEGVQHRVNMLSGCSTEILTIVTATSASTFDVSMTGLDSNCDLVKGWKATGGGTRIQ